MREARSYDDHEQHAPILTMEGRPMEKERDNMTDDLVKRLREVGGMSDDGATRWYINPDGPEAADRIEKLEAALREIAAASKVIVKAENMAQALVVVLTSHRKIALAALEDKQ